MVLSENGLYQISHPGIKKIFFSFSNSPSIRRAAGRRIHSNADAMDKAIGKSTHFSLPYHLFLIILKYNRRGCKKTMNYPAAPLCGIYALLGRSLWRSPIRSDKRRGIKNPGPEGPALI
jgi:hypothetical protein